MSKRIVLHIVLMLTFASYSQTDTINLFYDIGVFKLNESNYDKIQNKLDSLNDNLNYEVEIISSCDFLGSNKSNLTLSSQRAITVRDLLIIKKNVSIKSITYRGIGELPAHHKNAKGIANHRKTSLIFKDETEIVLENMASSKKGDVFVLRDIIFEPGRHFLKKESISTLNRLLKVLTENPDLEIELSGHVCCGRNKSEMIDGYDKDSKTYDLSENRARHIFKFLTLKHISPSRLSHKGYGFQKPLNYPELTELDKKMNRRVEIKIIKN